MSDVNEWNKTIIEEFRTNNGKVGGPFANMTLLLLHTTGAKSGLPRVNPLAYMADGDRYIVIASKAGAPTHPAWYHNLVANPEGSGGSRDRALCRAGHGGCGTGAYAALRKGSGAVYRLCRLSAQSNARHSRGDPDAPPVDRTPRCWKPGASRFSTPLSAGRTCRLEAGLARGRGKNTRPSGMQSMPVCRVPHQFRTRDEMLWQWHGLILGHCNCNELRRSTESTAPLAIPEPDTFADTRHRNTRADGFHNTHAITICN